MEVLKIEIYDIFKKYRAGETDVINILCRDGVEWNKNQSYDNYYGGSLKITNNGLSGTIHNLYKVYKKPYIIPKKKKDGTDNKIPKFHEQTYCGTENDLRSDSMIILIQIFNDKTFTPETSEEIYERFMFEMLRFLNKQIETSVYAITDTRVNKNGKEFSMFELIPVKKEKNVSSGFTGIYKEIAEIIYNYDIKELLRRDAETQKKIIDVIRQHYKYYFDNEHGTYKLPTQEDMISYYKDMFSESILQSEYSRALDSIFTSICQCTTSLKGTDLNRHEFKKISCQADIGSKVTFKNFSSQEDILLISLAQILKDYEPETVHDDRFYGIISQNVVREVTLKNKAVKQGIENKSSLTVDDYKELLNAIGFMLHDFCAKKLKQDLEGINSHYKDYQYEYLNKVPISLIDIAMGNPANGFYWYLYSKDDNVYLAKFKRNKNGEIIKSRSQDSEILVTNTRCLQIGKLKMIISDEDQKVYCLSADSEFLYVVKTSNNEYICYPNVA